MSSAKTFKLFALAACVQLLWGVTPSASKVVLGALPVETYAAFRYSVAGCLFLGYTLATNKRLQIRGRDLPLVAGIGVLAYAIDSFGTLYGLKLGGVLNFALASSLNAVITALLSLVFLRERPTIWLAGAGLLSCAGGLLLALGKCEVATVQIAAGSLALIWGAYVLEAIGFVYSKKLKARMPLTEYLGTAQLAAGLFLWCISFARGQSPRLLLAMPAPAALSLAYVCLVSCCLCYFLLYWLLRRIDGSRLAFFDAFHTLSAAVLGYLFFAEPFNAKMLAGGALLMLAVAAVTWPQLRRAKPKSSPLPADPASVGSSGA